MIMKKKKNLFEKFSDWATVATGSSAAFIIAGLTVLLWAVTGPVFKYSETWRLVINTGTTIVTLLMVFLIQKSQNKDSEVVPKELKTVIGYAAAANGTLAVPVRT
jgi:low affinity Fe/Cu permease